MLQKFALAFKTKTIEFFAEDEEAEEDDDTAAPTDPKSEEIITGQRVVVLKPDPAPRPDPQALAAAALATFSSFQAAYLLLQTAQSPFVHDDLRSADRTAVSHLRRLSELKRTYLGLGSTPSLSLSSHLETQVQENQDLLRSFEALVNRLQSDIDGKDPEAAALEKTLADLNADCARLAHRLERACMPAEDKVEALLTVGVFDSVLRDTCRVTHRFARIWVDSMKIPGWDLRDAANCICPDVNYAKPRHFRYALLSYVCLGMFEGFDSYDFCEDRTGVELNNIDVTIRRNDSLQQFIDHSALDPMETMRDFPSCDFANFCQKKYTKLIHPGAESSLSRNLTTDDLALRQSSHLYEPFVTMASSMWTLHKLAWAYDPVVEIFQVARGTEFSMVFMKNIVGKVDMMCIDHQSAKPKVGFTVVPGFRVGNTVIQSRVYLDGS
ncbi:protein GRAVITROPIC IN THE LIGHT 1-like [Zingiber officinale]|uniref:DUF641 domain-containing protein n=1 Tax=Zingiber officinale TaxID=94328 RepID=A0A8J5LF45_ZINOF|nr:protein GRAVITROPIC IN THE LIGHT 1-like [Zingiber officinale]XP_042382502.1 protein GRAVITROPIC IN THE LIGHT 1-like [Zingiber officinale]XP_042382503.1 protein GRAVITROPIC IN THE LIGHT 1-like [Zingiber officinale]XP_042382504.1 protein GRAVITROPIC IN THE LIGHT 1-like [Zingiber officinale]XP_042382505.1 protein GRAVITROPIC IN THE LIGHT 1-like [Zingiber officinale]XP_042382506.1 protein GRAVITROPIC IN THE LIGHT 1-like [Zingiber officinale]XP_042382507.1 protein GRAVITROPIC IN THE LIGHT 1-lik